MSDDFSQFFVTLIITEVQSARVVNLTKSAKIAKNRKSDDFLRNLRFITVISHVNVHFYRVHDHLKQNRLSILPNLL